MTIHEPARDIPLAFECDICVVGGSCTGVFAAVRAARLGMSVAVIENNVIFGGMATAAQVNEWHSLHDIHGERQIIGGLTVELLDRLRRRQAVRDMDRSLRGHYQFNSAEMALELDEMVREHSIRPFLSTRCVSAVSEGKRIQAAVIEDKSGRRAIRARFFIDASGDGDLLRHAGFPAWKSPVLQPVNYQAVIAGLEEARKMTPGPLWDSVKHCAAEFNYPPDNSNPWFMTYPSPGGLRNVYGPRQQGIDASDADQLTQALLEGRRMLRAFTDMVRKELTPHIAIVGLAHALGVRETWHAGTFHRLEGRQLLEGTRFPDAIANGTYPVDIHSPGGTVMKYLDGTEEVTGPAGSVVRRRWREDGPSPAYYQIPYRSLVPREAVNLLVAGRLLDADPEAFGAARVMVNMNQTGEAAGVAAFLSLSHDLPSASIPSSSLRGALAEGGTVIL